MMELGQFYEEIVHNPLKMRKLQIKKRKIFG